MQQLKPSEISELIRSRIQSLAISADIRTQGTVVTVTDGICRVHGLSDVMQGEMLEFPKNTFGLALNLERDSVGAVILGENEHITEGDTVKCTGKILSVPIGPELLGRVVNSLGAPIDGKGPINAKLTDVIEKVAPGVIATPLVKPRLEQNPYFRRLMVNSTPFPRVGEPEDVANAIAFLCSDEAAFVNGHVLVVDGGWIAANYTPTDA